MATAGAARLLPSSKPWMGCDGFLVLDTPKFWGSHEKECSNFLTYGVSRKIRSAFSEDSVWILTPKKFMRLRSGLHSRVATLCNRPSPGAPLNFLGRHFCGMFLGAFLTVGVTAGVSVGSKSMK